ncbi:phage tail protein (plasmid) [Raoultella ornithinolytica]|uniref:phage tail protein n=1 Tax=Raoultella ornithinolytica TaxID=54291 RepID=UPI00292B528B|nr:phage tail protein [Raoultella ornithinolytica]MDV1094977.1 phage tail protein [Raoultella ornithinolytica]MDV1122679.1 phage tail protein [Raoultella ornithinolytica]MDV1893194.1 phage tail protein [Raoultella ornithinolytica]
MGRFDEWLNEDVSQKRKEPDDDCTPTEATAPVEEYTGSLAEDGNGSSPSFSTLDDAATSVAGGPADAGLADSGSDEPEGDPDVAALPATLASREQNTTLRTRYNGHQAFNSQIRDDWMLIVESSPDAFQALLYRPDVGTYGVVDDETGEESFTQLDNNQRALTYQEPAIVYVLDNPDGRESFHAVDADGEQDGLTDDVLVLRIAANDVPVGSILEWNEEMTHGIARRWWYVHRIFSYGTQHVGSLYYCIPARNFDSTSEGEIQ